MSNLNGYFVKKKCFYVGVKCYFKSGKKYFILYIENCYGDRLLMSLKRWVSDYGNCL